MSANSPALLPSQVEVVPLQDSRDESTGQHSASTSISPLVAENDTTASAATARHPILESQETQQPEASLSSPTPAEAEITGPSESAQENIRGPAANVAPVAPVTIIPTANYIATPTENTAPATTTTAPATENSTPSSVMATSSSSSSPPRGPSVAVLSITLLMISGVRHQFTMDEKYLEQHSVKMQSGKEALKDPFEMSVGQLKECIWKDWKDEWDQRPASAMFIRLIHFGRMLEDRHPLKECRLTQDTPNVVHMTVRPPEIGDDEMTQRSTKGGFGSSRDNANSGSTPTCRCVIL